MPIADVLELIDFHGTSAAKGSEMLSEQSSAPVMLEKATLIKTEPTVLLVDDSITVRELLSMTFIMQATMWSRLVTVRSLGKTLRRSSCDIVFCDIEMNVNHGMHADERAQTEPSAHCYADFKGCRPAPTNGSTTGASGYITKPWKKPCSMPPNGC